MSIENILIDDLEDSVLGDIGIERTFTLKRLLLGDVANSERIEWVVFSHCMRLFDHHGIVWSINRRINPEREQVLMIWCHDTRSHDRAIVHLAIEIDWCCGQYASSPDLVTYRPILPEMECEDVFIVADSDDSLEDKNTTPCHNSILGPVVCVLPQDTIVDFMATDCIGQFDGISIRCMMPSIEVFDRTKAITSWWDQLKTFLLI